MAVFSLQENSCSVAFCKLQSFVSLITLSTLFFFYKNLVYKNIKALKCPRIKNVVVILLVAISISFKGFEKKSDVLVKKRV